MLRKGTSSLAARITDGDDARRWSARCAAALLLAVTISISETIAAEPELPPFDEVTAAVAAVFAGIADYQNGDLISASLVVAAVSEVSRAGWDVPRPADLTGRALADSHFLIRQASTPAGRRFLRAVAGMPSGYSQLDRLSTTHGGEKHIAHLIRQPDGHLFVQYLVTTSGGKSLGRRMASVPQGVNLNRPTGRIYTSDQLVDELKLIYDAEAAATNR